MATGLSFIATAHDGFPEAVTHMKSGILVGESDPEGIDHWFERLTGDDALRESLGRGAVGTHEVGGDLFQRSLAATVFNFLIL
jgi:glycosyltransferase involved in cell wall biosynthesis